MAPADLNILWMPDLLAAAQDFAANASAHASTFHSAWSKVCSIYSPKLSRNSYFVFCFFIFDSHPTISSSGYERRQI
jgi:hypothetical protein